MSSHEQRSEELEVVASMYPDEMVVTSCGGPHEDTEFVVNLRGFQLMVVLPEGYPDSARPRVVVEPAVPGLAEFLADLDEGDPQVAQLLEFVDDYARSAACSTENSALPSDRAQTQPDVTAITAEPLWHTCTNMPGLREGFRDAKYAEYGELWVQEDRGVTFQFRGDKYQVIVDGLGQADVDDFVAFTAHCGDYQGLPAAIATWSRAEKSDNAGFDEGEAEEDGCDHLDLRYIPSPSDIGADTTRPLKILTWGRAMLKQPPKADRNFNAAVLNGRGGGVDLRHNNGTSEVVQARISRCSKFPEWISMVVGKIEQEDYKVVSVNCTKGRHRSVAAAEIMKKVYYPSAEVQHLTIY